MTVCIASIISWQYTGGQVGRAVLAVSDRMLTFGGTFEYEPPQLKVGTLRQRASVLVAGDFAVHSEALQRAHQHLIAHPTDDLRDLANLYGSFVQGYRLRQAAHRVLSPLGLTREGLLAGEAGSLTHELAAQMQNHSIDVQAIVAGHDATGAHLYHVDADGFASCHDDAGFLAIGLGAPYASSQFMSAQYTNRWPFLPALLLSYSAKKRAEVAPGVGIATDMHVITRDDISPVYPPLFEKLEEIYKASEVRRAVAFSEDVGALDAVLKESKAKFDQQFAQPTEKPPSGPTYPCACTCAATRG